MTEHITHEEYVASVQGRIAETAKRMLSGDISFLDGSITLSRLRFEADVREDDPDFLVFVGIDSETHNYPMGKARQYWSKEALNKHQPEIDSLEKWAKEFGQEACESLIRRFHV